MSMFLNRKSGPMEVVIDLIRTNPDQPRKTFNGMELEELRDSIKEFGVIQPVILKKDGVGGYLLIAGERRLRASIMAGLTKIPAIIREADDRDAALIALIENVQRENLNYIEEAAAYKSLMEEYGLSQSEVAKRVGKQQSTISNKIRLLSLPAELCHMLGEHQLTERHARALLKIPDNEQRKLILEKIIAHNLNVKQSEKLIEDFLTKQEEEKRKAGKLRYINYKIYLNTIKKAFTTINEVEKDAEYKQEDKGDHLEVTIIIPKKAAV